MDSVQPLRISKSTPSSSPNKMVTSRPLAEIGSTERRRNSPSYNQATRKQIVSHETSPYMENSSPPSFNKPSPREFWSSRQMLSPSHVDDENSTDRSPSPGASPKKRPSIERLQKAGRVKTSNIFALENKDSYNPATLPIVERPSANRPLSEYLVNNSFARADSMRKENSPFRSPNKSHHKRTESEIHLPMLTPTKNAAAVPLPASPEKYTPSSSPNKSSLSRNSMFAPSTFDSQLDNEEPALTPRALQRMTKSVTFNEAAPVVNEYDDPTPEPSVSMVSDRESSWDSEDFDDASYSFERGSSADPGRDDSFDADLENADKTPVVLPEDWSRMSPSAARTDLIEYEDDVFGGGSTQRIASDGSEGRPLPPLPGFTPQKRRDSTSLTAAAQRAANSPRVPPVVPQLATCSKDEILRMGHDSTAETHDESVVDLSEIAAPRISRESILKKARNSKYEFDDEDDVEESELPESPGRLPIAELAKMDPDQPIPSRETSHEGVEEEVKITTEPVEEEVKIKIEPAEEEAGDDDASRYSSIEPDAEGTMLHHELDDPTPVTQASARQGSGDFMGLPAYLASNDFDLGMQEYITPSPPAISDDSCKKLEETRFPSLQPSAVETEPQESSTEDTASRASTPESVIHHSGEFASIGSEDESPPMERLTPEEIVVPERSATIKTGGKLKTRKSNTQADLEMMAQQRRMVSLEILENPIPSIPREFVETQSEEAAAADGHAQLELEAEQEKPKPRRKSRKSGGRMDLMLDESTFGLADVSLPDEDILGGLDQEFDRVIEGSKKGYLTRQNTKIVVATNREFSGESNQSESIKPNDEPPMSPTGDASHRPASRGTRVKPRGSPRKGSDEQVLKTEPWNGKSRTRSTRGTSHHKAAQRNAVAPPLPGQESALGVVDEDYAAGSANLTEEVGEGVERGRLFVKVVGVKRLDLPLPKNERVNFQLTLDNGLHCVTTSDLELGTSAPIGQEFELVVLNDLEFQLTLTATLPPPPPRPSSDTPSSPQKSGSRSPAKCHGFSRFLISPKKRAEKDRQEREAAECEERRLRAEQQRKRASMIPTAWDLLHTLVSGTDGSFARAYVNLSTHEPECFGRPLTVDAPCYNEWALEQDAAVINSVRSKRGAHSGPIRRPPYVVGQLELQMLYVPKPKGAVDEQMPGSMSAASREMNKAREVQEVVHEGFLSQQGGDCIHWRRRFFRLQDARLTAYHEHTNQKRAVINLSKARRVIDDKTTLLAAPAAPTSPSKSSGGRRKSGFAEEDEAYAYVEEGFRVRFANGETIDFYADSRAAKDAWMRVLGRVIGTAGPADTPRAPRWTDLVLARERAAAATAAPGVQAKDFGPGAAAAAATTDTPAATQAQSRVSEDPAGAGRALGQRKPVGASGAPMTSKSLPGSPVKGYGAGSASPKKSSMVVSGEASPAKGLRPKSTQMVNSRANGGGREAVKSMIF